MKKGKTNISNLPVASALLAVEELKDAIFPQLVVTEHAQNDKCALSRNKLIEITLFRCVIRSATSLDRTTSSVGSLKSLRKLKNAFSKMMLFKGIQVVPPWRVTLYKVNVSNVYAAEYYNDPNELASTTESSSRVPDRNFRVINAQT